MRIIAGDGDPLKIKRKKSKSNKQKSDIILSNTIANYTRAPIALSTKLSDEELPLKFEEIVDVKTYDKMRPPRPGG